MELSKVAVIIPAYNEATSIGSVIAELNDYMPGVNIIVVDDGSGDNTAKEAEAAGATVVTLATNQGYANAIEQGFIQALNQGCYQYVVTVDADGQHHPKSVKAMIELAQNTDDLIIGQRTRAARWSEWLFGLYFNAKFSVKDPLCGLRLYRLSMFTKYGAFETYDSIGTELMTWIILQGKCYKTLDVEIRYRADKPRFGTGFSVNQRIFKSLLTTLSFVKRHQST